MIKDRNIGYKYKRDWFPATGFNTYEHHAVDENDARTAFHRPTVGGSEGLVEIGSLGVVGASMDTEDDFLRMMLPLPSHWDVDNDIHFRVLWSDGADDDAHSITWKLLWNSFQFQQAPAAGVDDATALTFTADANSTVSNSIDATTWATLNGGTWSEDLGFLVFDVECHVDFSDLEPILVGLEVAYLPKLTSGTQVSDQADPTDA